MFYLSTNVILVSKPDMLLFLNQLASPGARLTVRPWKVAGPRKERIVFQPSFFRGELLNFGGVAETNSKSGLLSINMCWSQLIHMQSVMFRPGRNHPPANSHGIQKPMTAFTKKTDNETGLFLIMVQKGYPKQILNSLRHLETMIISYSKLHFATSGIFFEVGHHSAKTGSYLIYSIYILICLHLLINFLRPKWRLTCFSCFNLPGVQ